MRPLLFQTAMSIVIGATAANPAGAAMAASPGCAEAVRAVPDLPFCAEAPNGVALAATEARANEVAGYARDGEARFQHHFGRPVDSSYATFDHDTEQEAVERRTALAEAGFGFPLPLASEALQMETRRQAVRRMAEAQAVAQGLSEEEARTAADAAWARAANALLTPRRDANFVPHELGHKWYANAFWKDVPRPEGPIYGSPAPDWLDEAAAIIVEGEQSRETRRQEFGAAVRGEPRRSSTGTEFPPLVPIDLPEFLAALHPAIPSLASAEAQSSAPLGGFRVMARPGTNTSAIFYPQALAVADYLIDRSGDPAILAVVSEALRQDGDLEAWLASEGVRSGLPTSIPLLDDDWRAWLEMRFGDAQQSRS